jgi:hypothetical protein
MTIKDILRKLIKYRLLKLGEKKARLPILFIHTPKTAGTSFRRAALVSRNIKHVLCDYGKDNATTTPAINTVQYYSSDERSIEFILKEYKNYILTGHFSADRYKMFFYPYEIGIFIREPVDRVLSNYYHKKRKGDFSDSLEAFIQTNAASNLQLKQFGDLAPEYFGFIGVSDRYDESIALINALYSIDLKVLKLNSNPSKKSTGYEVQDDIRRKICDSNNEEIELYKSAEKLFQARLNFKDIMHPLYGSWQFESKLKINGRAYRAYSDSPVKIVLQIDGNAVTTSIASIYNPIPCDVKQPREGYIGFEFDISELVTDNSSIRISAEDTHEPLFNLKH